MDASQGQPTPPETRLHALLHSNVPGASSDFPAVESAISEIDVELAPLKQDILELQTRLSTLEFKRDELMSRRDQHRAIVSALRRMPPETLGEIFMWTLPSVADIWETPDVFGIKATPWVLTHVCSRWRQIAVEMPALWSLVMILYTDYNFPLAAVELQVQRAKNLRIHVYGSHRREPGPQVEVLTYLIEHSARWEELSIGLTREMNLILPTVQDRLPLLRRLCLEWDEEDGAEETALNVDCFQSATSLVDLRICRRWQPISYSAPANQLTRYTADAPWETHRAILSVSPGLIQAHISAFPVLPDPEPNPEVIQLSQLQCLYVSHVDLLQYFKVPVLEQVTLRVTSDELDITPALHRFIVDTASTVRRLGLRGLPDTGLASQILARYTSITELAILIFGGDGYQYTEHEFSIPNALISLLDIPPVSEGSPVVIAPKLTHVHIAFEDLLPVNADIFVRMLETRSQLPGGALRAVTVTMEQDPQLPAYILEKLNGLRERSGFEFSLVVDTNIFHHVAPWTCNPTWN
ncbi:hypothetical protein FB45DRAFT_1067638 [Roridomyces roridus]|uniref:F-box domain-containing protein n=1 Tax=Roridomyces roridus TaxID=1738132 RepID=A0AAD7B1K5_9AGAR|nr:hypothetical protein FB45DRAFT_1067638 [Roridomyces roridus]